MTIDSGWVRVFKEQVPRAFVNTCPFRPKVAYIDGMPLLMLSEGRVKQWSDFLRSNYARTIVRYFRLGCEAVVLAFDDYDHVPKAKSITQAKRAKAKAAYEFGEGQQLPPTIPDKFNEKLTNRVFKRRVIDMICNCIIEHITPLPLKDNGEEENFSRKFIVDYSSCPVQFTCPVGSLEFDKKHPVFLTDLPPMGEADVKFLRWAQVFQGDIVAYSVDGDFIPIALIHHERQLLVEKRQQPFRVALYRMKYKMPPVAKKSVGSVQDKNQLLLGKKRKKGEEDGGSSVVMLSTAAEASAAAVSAASSAKNSSNRREYEYVDVSALYEGLYHVFDELQQETQQQVFYMRLLAVLIGLAGTDFSRWVFFCQCFFVACVDHCVVLMQKPPARGTLYHVVHGDEQ
jgi:hypothetical protein